MRHVLERRRVRLRADHGNQQREQRRYHQQAGHHPAPAPTGQPPVREEQHQQRRRQVQQHPAARREGDVQLGHGQQTRSAGHDRDVHLLEHHVHGNHAHQDQQRTHQVARLAGGDHNTHHGRGQRQHHTDRETDHQGRVRRGHQQAHAHQHLHRHDGGQDIGQPARPGHRHKGHCSTVGPDGPRGHTCQYGDTSRARPDPQQSRRPETTTARQQLPPLLEAADEAPHPASPPAGHRCAADRGLPGLRERPWTARSRPATTRRDLAGSGHPGNTFLSRSGKSSRPAGT